MLGDFVRSGLPRRFGPAPRVAAEPQPEDAKRLGVMRADLAASYLQLEQVYFADPPEGERAAEINKAFDRSTLAFFTGRSDQALEQINRLSESLANPPAGPAELAADSLKAAIEPPVLTLASWRRPEARIVSIYETPLEEPTEVVLRLKVVASDGAVAWEETITLRCGPGCKVDTTVPVTLAAEGLRAGLYRVELASPQGVSRIVGRLNVIDGPPLEQQRTENAKRLEDMAAPTPQLVQALATCRARNALLTDQPSADNSAQFLADLGALARDVRQEIGELAAGKDPYAHRAGTTARAGLRSR